jgi:hypothetical protein
MTFIEQFEADNVALAVQVFRLFVIERGGLRVTRSSASA